MSDISKTQTIGCLVGFARVLVTTPLYYIFMYMILQHINATETIWMMFWIYVPVSLGMAIIFEIASALAKADKEK